MATGTETAAATTDAPDPPASGPATNKVRALAATIGSLTILDAAQATRPNLAPGAAERAGPLAMLTGREREIARLAATGSTSRAIAEQLSPARAPSTPTCRKLALPSRAALARLLAGGGTPT
jgi:hypothetical protein